MELLLNRRAVRGVTRYLVRWRGHTSQVLQRGSETCPQFSSESIYAGNFYLENYLTSSLNDFCKRKKTPENGYLASFRLVWSNFRPNRGTGPPRFTPCRETSSLSAIDRSPGARRQRWREGLSCNGRRIGQDVPNRLKSGPIDL